MRSDGMRKIGSDVVQAPSPSPRFDYCKARSGVEAEVEIEQ